MAKSLIWLFAMIRAPPASAEQERFLPMKRAIISADDFGLVG
jgi:hypothetical protein